MTENLGCVVEQFLAHKRTLDRKYLSEEAELRLLVRFAEQHHVDRLDQLTAALLDDFLASRPRSRPRSFNHLLGVVRGLLAIAVNLPWRFAGEVCGLRLGDVDAQRHLLVVRGGKFGKTRLVPHGPRIGALIAEQLARRRADGAVGDDAPLFSFDGRRRVHPGSASQVFHHLVATLELAVPEGVSPPRLHDLRHSFAVGCLLRWYRDGLDPSTRLQHLATYLGHVDPASTAVYLTITPELLAEANHRFEGFSEPAWREIVR